MVLGHSFSPHPKAPNIISNNFQIPFLSLWRGARCRRAAGAERRYIEKEERDEPRHSCCSRGLRTKIPSDVSPRCRCACCSVAHSDGTACLLDGLMQARSIPLCAMPACALQHTHGFQHPHMHTRTHAGSFGQVWKCWDVEERAYVAIKHIRGLFTGSPREATATAMRMLREVKLLRLLGGSPGVCMGVWHC